MGGGVLGVSYLQSPPPPLMMLSLPPTKPANLKPSLARSEKKRKKETERSLSSYTVSLLSSIMAQSCRCSLREPQGGGVGSGLYPESCHYTAPQLTQTSTSCLTTLRFYKVKLTHLNLLYLFSCNRIFKHVPLKQKKSKLHPCKCPPMISLILSAGTCPRKMSWKKFLQSPGMFRWRPATNPWFGAGRSP